MKVKGVVRYIVNATHTKYNQICGLIKMKTKKIELFTTINLFFLLTLLISFFVVSPDASALTKPTLLSPANNAEITTKTVTFSWSHPYNDQYELKIKTNGGTLKYASGKISSKSKTVDLSSIPLTYGSTYKWYVVVYALGQEDSSEDRWFTYKFDATKPVVSSFNVTPSSVSLGGSFSISYTVSDAGGSGLKQVELWRANDSGGSPSGWAQITTRALSGNGPSTGSFSNAPTTGGTYWYGVHVVDNAGNWSAEPSPRKVTVGGTAASTTPSDHKVNGKNTGWCYPLKDLCDNQLNCKTPVQNITFGFMSYRDGWGYHYAQDITRNNSIGQSYKEGDPVFAMANGNIIKIRQTGGYGGSGYNTMLVKYQYIAKDGTIKPVYVMYGHVKAIRNAPAYSGVQEISVNIPIERYKEIAYLNDPGDHVYHLHLVVMPDNYPGEWYDGYNDSAQVRNGRARPFDAWSNINGGAWSKDWVDINGYQNSNNRDEVFFDTYMAAFSTFSCNTVTPENFYQSAYNNFGAPFDLFGGNVMLVDTKCSSSDTHTIKATLGIPGNTTRIVYMKGYYYDPSISNWKQYTPTCNGTLNGDWCMGSATANITNPNISTASASAPAYFLGMVCSMQNGQWKCGCRDTTCANSYWQIQGAGR